MHQLPTGTVTFLFTDVEGSTRIWDTFPDDMRTAISLHDELVVAAATDHGGSVVKHTGDGLFIAFDSAPRALACAVDAQRRLAAADWPEVVGSLGVRMALHTAEAEPKGGDYLSPEVNRVARLEAAGHGGQILLSDSTRSLVPEPLEDVEVQYLGRHTLRGISRPEHIHQAVIRGLRTTFPPLRTTSLIEGSLPTFGTSFIGRARELDELSRLIEEPSCRWITLVGPGGIGKSRLAVQVAQDTATRLGATAHFLSLGSVTDPANIIRALADSIGFSIDLHLSAQVGEKSQVFDRLRSQAMILVLDTLEHLPAAAPLLTEMIMELPDLRLLATSRQRLGVSSERVFVLDGMESHDDGLALLADRVRRFGGLVEQQSDEARELVDLLGGMPLAIELAAAWTPHLAIEDIVAEVRSDLDFLSSTAADVPERHRSVRAVFEQTWRRLDPELRSALTALSVFVAPFTREAAKAVAGSSVATMARLMESSLLRREPLAATYSIPPLLREFALERMEYPQEITERYARHYLDHLASRRERLRGREQLAARDEISSVLEHVRFALAWGVENLPDTEMMDLIQAFGEFLFLYSWLDQVTDMQRLIKVAMAAFGTEAALSRDSCLLTIILEAVASQNFRTPDEVDELLQPVLVRMADAARIVRLGALMVRGINESYRSDFPSAVEWLERATALDTPHDPLFSATLATWLGWAQLQLGDAEKARQTFQVGLERATEDGHEIARAFLLSKLGAAADGLGDHRLAVEYHHEGREVFTKAGDLGGQGFTLSRLSWSHYLLGDWEVARRYALEGLEKFEMINHRWGIAVSYGRLGLAEVKLGQLESAAEHFLETIRVAGEAGLPDQLHYGVLGIGLVLHADRHFGDAARLLLGSLAAEMNPYKNLVKDAVDDLRSELGAEFEVMVGSVPTDLDMLVREARARGRDYTGTHD